MSGLRLTWAWAWTMVAAGLLALAAAIIAAIAISGSDRDEVALAVALIGFPAVLGACVLGTLAVVAARPAGARPRSVRRWALALAGAVAVVGGVIRLEQGSLDAVLLVAVGASILALLALDVRRGKRE